MDNKYLRVSIFVAVIFIAVGILIYYRVANANSNVPVNTSNSDDKFYCENVNDCVDGEYCQVTAPGACVGAKWWWANVGDKYDCMPDPSLCSCVNNKCVKK